MMRPTIATLCALLLVLVTACSDDGGDQNGQPDPDTGAADTGQADTGADAEADTGPSGCEFQADCADGQYCHDGACHDSPGCNGNYDWDECVEAFEAVEEGLGRRAICHVDHCELVCLTDADCADGQLCSDNGRCIPFTGELTGEHPGGDARGALQAGVAQALLEFPIGLSQGGYGSRAAPNDGRYVESLSATDGQMHGLYARAFVLDNGERQLMFVRLPIIFPSAAMHEALARRLQERTGKDWRDSLLISGTHTHSGPTRYWQLPDPDDTLVPLGTFGTDEFHQQVFDWIVGSAFDAASGALDDLAPAKFGWEIVEAFDTDDRISSDRWGATPAFDDNRLLLFRIDDAQGNPRAVMISYGTHGTIHSNSYFTGDSLMGVERGLEQKLGDEYDRFVPVLYFNQNGGTMSPRGDHFGHKNVERFEALGHQFTAKAFAAVRDMTTTDDLALDGVTHRFPITYEYVGYGPGEWTKSGAATRLGEYEYGGIQCMGGQEDDDYATHTAPSNVRCLPVHQLSFHRPVSLFARGQISAFAIDGLTMVTMPGELSMELGWQTLRQVRDDWGVDPLSAWTFGYAQDHHFYLLPSNLRGELPPFSGFSNDRAPDDYPDFAYSYLQGGYEPTLGLWGWRYGDFLVERASEAVGLLQDASVDLALPPALPLEYSRVDSGEFPIDASDPAAVGTVVAEVPDTVKRFEPIEFGWIGGDPGAEMPQAPRVVLERQQPDDSFAEVTRASRRPYDNREPVMLTRLRTNDAGEHEWLVRWEEIQDFPTGAYRFRVEGHYLDDAGGRTAYQVTSQPFELVPTDQLVVELHADSLSSGRIAYPAGQPLAYAGDSADLGRVEGNFRMRHPEVPFGLAAPLVAGRDVTPADITVEIHDSDGQTVATLTGDDLTLTTAVEQDSATGRTIPVTRLDGSPGALPAGDYSSTVTVTDAYGNTGTGRGSAQIR